MKSLFLILVLFSLINSVHAQNLCDQSCVFSATFPQGGSLEAVDELTLIFGTDGELILGTGGTVNAAIQPSTVDFSAGGTLTLSAGESITFGPGGSLVLGTGGNIDALSYNLTSTGDISIGATGESRTINIGGSWDVSENLSFTSPSLELGSTISAGSQLNLQSSTIITGSGSISVPESATISVGNVGTVLPTSLSLSSNTGVIDASNVLLITSDDTVTPITGPITFQPLLNLDGLNGLEMPTSDGNTCIVTSPECVADDGTTYILSTEGKLVEKEAPSDTSTSGKSGSFPLPLLSFFMILLVSPRLRKN